MDFLRAPVLQNFDTILWLEFHLVPMWNPLNIPNNIQGVQRGEDSLDFIHCVQIKWKKAQIKLAFSNRITSFMNGIFWIE